jgi:ABC-type molybdate transport system permease subunit
MSEQRLLPIIAPLVLGLLLLAMLSANSSAGETPTATFSIVAYDPETQEWGVAVASRVLVVGYIVPWAEANLEEIRAQR